MQYLGIKKYSKIFPQNLKGILFDLDQTLIDSWSGKTLRKSGKWPEVYNLIPTFKPFNGINEILELLNKRNIPIAIVSSNPREYCRSIISYWDWDIQILISCDDVVHLKPHPEPFIIASQKLNIKFENLASVGDQKKDVIASRLASIFSIAALWGSKDPYLLLSSIPDYICKTTSNLLEFIDIFLK